MKLFLSWSGEASHNLARAFKDWIEVALQQVETFISSEDIKVGDDWFAKLTRELQDTALGVLFLTPENLTSPWLHFEAGAIAKIHDKAALMPVLVGLKPDEVLEPFSKFQGAPYHKAGMLRLFRAINASIQPKLDEDRLVRTFEVNWPQLKAKFDPIAARFERSGEVIREQMSILTSSKDVIETNKRIVLQAEKFFVATGSRSRDAAYLNLIRDRLLNMPSLVHYRILIQNPYHDIFKQHLLDLLDIRDPADRTVDGEQKLYIGLFTQLELEPEKFVCANEKEALIVLPSFDAIRKYDTALLISNPKGVAGTLNYVKGLFNLSRELRTKAEVEALQIPPGA